MRKFEWRGRAQQYAWSAALALGLAACGGGGSADLAGPSSGFQVDSASTVLISLDAMGALSHGSHDYRVTNMRASENLEYEVTSNAAWAQVLAPGLSTLTPGSHADVPIAFNGLLLTGLGAGDHEATITISEPNVPDSEPVVRTVLATVLPPVVGPARVTAGLLALYEFDESSGTTVGDTSGVGAPLDLQILSPTTIVWQPGILKLEGDSEIVTAGAASKITDACKLSDEITIEAWVTPATTVQSGPARVVSLSDGSLERNVTLGHGGSGAEPSTAYNVRGRTTTTTTNGIPALITAADEIPASLHHVVYTRSFDGTATVYIDGVVSATQNVGGDLSNWDDSYRLAFGNEVGASRPWYGSFHLVAFYDRALLPMEVEQNRVAGARDQLFGSIVVSPTSDFVSFGITGSDLSGEFKTYTVSNPGTEPAAWSVTSSQPWCFVDGQASGTLAPGGSRMVTVRLDGVAVAALGPGTYVSDLDWVNTTNGFGDVTLHAQVILANQGDPNGKPGPNNTGPSNPGILVPSGSITANTNGQIIENVSINGTITIQANNVTVRNFRINAQGNAYGIHTGLGPYSGTVIEDGEIYNLDSSGILGKNFIARQLNIHESGGDGIKSRGNVLVENCWIHHVGTNPGAHADGNQTRGGNDIIFRHNNIDMPVSTSPAGQAGYLSNAAIIIQDEVAEIDNFLIEDNWLNGGNYTIMIDADDGGPTNLVVRNNRFGRDFRYGTSAFDGIVYTASGNVWEDNMVLLGWNNQ